MDLQKAYDVILALQEELENPFDSQGQLDPKALKALVATYELQDYLTSRISSSTPKDKTNPETNDK